MYTNVRVANSSTAYQAANVYVDGPNDWTWNFSTIDPNSSTEYQYLYQGTYHVYGKIKNDSTSDCSFDGNVRVLYGYKYTIKVNLNSVSLVQDKAFSFSND